MADEKTVARLRELDGHLYDLKQLAHAIGVTHPRENPRVREVRMLAGVVEEFATPLLRVTRELIGEIVREQADIRRASEPPQCDHVIPDQCDLCRTAR